MYIHDNLKDSQEENVHKVDFGRKKIKKLEWDMKRTAGKRKTFYLRKLV